MAVECANLKAMCSIVRYPPKKCWLSRGSWTLLKVVLSLTVFQWAMCTVGDVSLSCVPADVLAVCSVPLVLGEHIQIIWLTMEELHTESIF